MENTRKPGATSDYLTRANLQIPSLTLARCYRLHFHVHGEINLLTPGSNSEADADNKSFLGS